MTTTATLFDQLNRFRTRNGKKPLKSWKESRAKLEAALNAEAARNDFEAPLEEIQKQQTRQEIIHTKEHVIEAAPVEHKTHTKEHTQSLKAARLQKQEAEPKLTKNQRRMAAKKSAVEAVVKNRTKATFSAAQIILDFGIDPKQGRALLRKHNVAKTPEAVRAFFTARKKK